MSQDKSPGGLLVSLSSELAGIVERVAPSVVRVDDGTRLTAGGVIWSADGIIVATSHGVERDEDLAIETAEGARYAALLLGRDHDTDIAALRVDAAGLPEIAKASSAEARVGNLALALGRPGESSLQATIGVITRKFETQTNGLPGSIYYTDATLYPGFSGGPLVDMSGRMIGMVNLMFGRGRGVALGVDVLEPVVNALLAHGRIRRGYLGVRTQEVAIPENLRQTHGLKQESGMLLVQVESGGPAEKSGLLLGDTLLAVNGQPLEDVDDLRARLRNFHAGQEVSLRILRGGQLLDLRVTLGVQE